MRAAVLAKVGCTRWLLSGLLSIGLLFGISHAANAQVTEPVANEFRQIEQPIGLKLGVAATGIGLIGLELWWFLAKKAKTTS